MKKKLTAMMLAAACMLNCTLTANAAETASGDVNGDGNITVSDAIMLARIVAEDITVSVTEEGKRNADLNASGAPDSDDITLLLKQLAGLVTPVVPPAEPEVHFEFAGESQKSMESAMRFSMKSKVFCAKGETLTVEMGMGDDAFRNGNEDSGENYHLEISVCNPLNFQKIEDEKLTVNGSQGGYDKIFAKDETASFDIRAELGNYEKYHHETAEFDFSGYQTGESGCIKFLFQAEINHNTRGAGQLVYFYVGENGVGLSRESAGDAETACNTKRNKELFIHDAYTGKRNEKFITRDLFEAFSKESAEPVAVWMSFTVTGDFIYNGKTLDEYSNDQHSETLDKLDQLLNSGDVLKYGEAVYTTGTPDGTKWSKELYDARVEFFGEELLSEYIVDDEFLKEQLRADFNDLFRKNREAYLEAEEAYYTDAAEETARQLKSMGIPCEARTDIRRVLMLVTAEQFDALDFEKAACYGLAEIRRDIPEQSVQPTTAQPVCFDDLNAAAEALNGYDLSVYPEQYQEIYRQMYDRFNREKFAYQMQDNDAIVNQNDRSVTLFPNVQYEDIGIGYYLTFRDKTYHITFYSANEALASESDGIADYLQKRTGRRTDKEITVQERTVSLTNPQDDGIHTELYASAWLDDTHYFSVKAVTSEEEMTEFLNALSIAKYDFDQPAAG